MKKILMRLAGVLAAFVPMIFVGCEQDSDLDVKLAVDAVDIKLAKEGGNTNFIIYSTGEWDIVLSEQVDWMSLSVLKGYGKGNVQISASPNYGVVRAVDLLINGSGESRTVRFTQAGEDIVFSFVTKYEVSKTADEFEVELRSNLGRELENVRDSIAYVKYLYDDEDDEDVPVPEGGWIKSVGFTPEGNLNVSILENTTDRPRKVEIWLLYEDATEKKHSTFAEIVQSNSIIETDKTE